MSTQSLIPNNGNTISRVVVQTQKTAPDLIVVAPFSQCYVRREALGSDGLSPDPYHLGTPFCVSSALYHRGIDLAELSFTTENWLPRFLRPSPRHPSCSAL